MHLTIIFAIFALIPFSQANVIEKRDIAEIPANSCISAPGEWKCCATSPPIGDFRVTGCINIEFLRNKTKGLKLKITFNDYTFLEEKFSDTLCYHIPYLKKMAKVCLKFYDIAGKDHPDSIFSGCSSFLVNIVGRQVLKVNIGCFNFPINTINNEESNSSLQDINHEESNSSVQDINHEESVENESFHSSTLSYEATSPKESEMSTAAPIWSPVGYKFPKMASIETEITYDHLPSEDIELPKTTSYTTTIVLFSVLILCLILLIVFTIFIIQRYRGMPIRYNLFT